MTILKLTKDSRDEILISIAEDMKEDAKAFDGQVFDGKTVAKYSGYQGAAIAALADVVRSMNEETK